MASLLSTDVHRWTHEVARQATLIRLLTLEQSLRAGGGYLAQACSSAEILATLYGHLMNLGPSTGPSMPERFRGTPGAGAYTHCGGRYNGDPAPERDRFVLSPSHYAIALYAALVAAGRLDEAALAEFNSDGGSVEMIGAEHSPGFELTSGSFGQALSQAAGIALARKRRGDTGRTWVFLSDGEMQEGQTWEAVQFIAFYRLTSLRVVVDVNGQQVDGRTADVMNVEPLDARFAGFGVPVMRVDGHSPAALARAFETAGDDPLIVLADTDPTRGVPLLKGRWPKLHYVRFADGDRVAYEGEALQMRTALGLA